MQYTFMRLYNFYSIMIVLARLAMKCAQIQVNCGFFEFSGIFLIRLCTEIKKMVQFDATACMPIKS